LPQSLNEHIITPGAFVVHVDVDAMFLEQAGERLRSKLKALIGVHDLRWSVDGNRLMQHLDIKMHVHAD